MVFEAIPNIHLVLYPLKPRLTKSYSRTKRSERRLIHPFGIDAYCVIESPRKTNRCLLIFFVSELFYGLSLGH